MAHQHQGAARAVGAGFGDEVSHGIEPGVVDAQRLHPWQQGETHELAQQRFVFECIGLRAGDANELLENRAYAVSRQMGQQACFYRVIVHGPRV